MFKNKEAAAAFSGSSFSQIVHQCQGVYSIFLCFEQVPATGQNPSIDHVLYEQTAVWVTRHRLLLLHSARMSHR